MQIHTLMKTWYTVEVGLQVIEEIKNYLINGTGKIGYAHKNKYKYKCIYISTSNQVQK